MVLLLSCLFPEKVALRILFTNNALKKIGVPKGTWIERREGRTAYFNNTARATFAPSRILIRMKYTPYAAGEPRSVRPSHMSRALLKRVVQGARGARLVGCVGDGAGVGLHPYMARAETRSTSRARTTNGPPTARTRNSIEARFIIYLLADENVTRWGAQNGAVGGSRKRITSGTIKVCYCMCRL